MNVGVFGSSLPAAGSAAYEEAREVGREIARRGGRIVCGGYGGVMEAACRGASELGGKSLGVLLSGRGHGNGWLTERVAVPDFPARLGRLCDASDAWIFLPRGLGTMLELAWMAESVVKGEAAARPLVLLGDFWDPTVETMLREATGSDAGALAACVRRAQTPEEAVRLALGEVSTRD